MPLRKITLVSNNICYGPMPSPEDEVEQRLTITSTGQVWFTGYAYADGFGRYAPCRKKRIRIGSEVANRTLSFIDRYFQGDYLCCFATDVGDWKIELTYADGTTRKETGSLCEDLLVDDVWLSDYIRQNIPIENLFVFDGAIYPDDEEQE